MALVAPVLDPHSHTLCLDLFVAFHSCFFHSLGATYIHRLWENGAGVALDRFVVHFGDTSGRRGSSVEAFCCVCWFMAGLGLLAKLLAGICACVALGALR